MKLDQLNKNLILQECKKIKVPDNITGLDLINSFQVSNFLTPILLEHYQALDRKGLLTWNKVDYLSESQYIMNEFLKDVLPQLKSIKNSPISPKNLKKDIFSAAGCEHLSKSNDYTRKITTTLGRYLEKIVDKSPRTFSTEAYFEDLKIKGVDTIIYRDKKLYFTQLKTKQDTLTGSQKNRSNLELEIFDNSIFAAQFDLGNWTFSSGSPKIQRVSGAAFWSLIDVEYNEIKKIVFASIKIIEDELF